MPINYVTGDATKPDGAGPKVIVHCCNDEGLWGAGFVLALSKMWPKAEAAYKAWPDANPNEPWFPPTIETSGPFELGQVQFVLVGPKIWVANLIGQHGVGVSDDGRPPIRYDAIRTGLMKVKRFCQIHDASVHMPRMGAGLAGGNWTAIEQTIKAELMAHGVSVTVYDLPARA